MRFLPADDPRIIATVHAIAEELTVHGTVMRWQLSQAFTHLALINAVLHVIRCEGADEAEVPGASQR